MKKSLLENYEEKVKMGANKTKSTSPLLDGVLLQLEVTNTCNHSCIFCPNHSSQRKKVFMDYEFARNSIMECANFLGKDKRICFHMNGEPLLYKQLPELVALAKEYGYSYIFITTNGTVGDKEIYRKIYEAGLDSIKFSINGGTAEAYRKIHGKDDFKKAISALKYAWEWKKEHNPNMNVFVSCVGNKMNKSSLKRLQRLVEPFCNEVLLYYQNAYAGQVLDMEEQMRCDLSDLEIKTFDLKHTIPCPVLWNSINITCEGYLALCCSSGTDHRMIIDDLKNKSIQDTWLRGNIQKIREKHRKNDIVDTPCYACITEGAYIKEDMNKKYFCWL